MWKIYGTLEEIEVTISLSEWNKRFIVDAVFELSYNKITRGSIPTNFCE